VPQGRWQCHHDIVHGIWQSIRKNTETHEAITEGVHHQCQSSKSIGVKSHECEIELWMIHFASTPVVADIDANLFMNACDLASSPSSVHACYTFALTE